MSLQTDGGGERERERHFTSAFTINLRGRRLSFAVEHCVGTTVVLHSTNILRWKDSLCVRCDTFMALRSLRRFQAFWDSVLIPTLDIRT